MAIKESVTPYDEALKLIEQHPGTGSSSGLAKLILALYNEDHAFGVGECVRAFVRTENSIAQRMINYYFEHGEDDALRDAGYTIRKTWPRLVELADAACQAKYEVEKRWDAERNN